MFLHSEHRDTGVFKKWQQYTLCLRLLLLDLCFPKTKVAILIKACILPVKETKLDVPIASIESMNKINWRAKNKR